jgi:hyperosmotically inducible protein
MLAVLAVGAACSTEGGGGTSDAQLRQEVASRLEAANLTTIEANVQNGVVTLTGTAPDEASSDKAAELARGVKGVASVTNQVQVAGGSVVGLTPPGTVAPPQQIDVNNQDSLTQARVQQKLLADPALAGSNITPTVSGGVATLAGTVPSDSAKAAAEKTAKSVSGVTSVVNQITVTAVQVASVPDDKIKDDVITVLDKSFPDLALFPEVKSGNVSLSGAVPNASVIVQVTKTIHGVTGVKAVDTSRLTVQGGEPDDKKIGAPATTKP